MTLSVVAVWIMAGCLAEATVVLPFEGYEDDFYFTLHTLVYGTAVSMVIGGLAGRMVGMPGAWVVSGVGLLMTAVLACGLVLIAESLSHWLLVPAVLVAYPAATVAVRWGSPR